MNDGDSWDDHSTLLHTRYDPTPVAAARFDLHVVAGPDKGKRFVVAPDAPARVLVGTGPACEIRLTDRRVSRRHAALLVEGERLRLTDLSSTNGTSVAGIVIVEGLLSGGESIVLGDTTLEVHHAKSEAPGEPPAVAGFGRFVGASTEVRRLYPLFQRIAQANVPVVIEGETGTGKEMLAEALHEQGPRAAGPFVVFDCTTVPPNLMESELFGHEKGAFSGATTTRRGVFELAHGGTLLIDEIGDLELSLQPKLLRAIEKNEFRRVGGEKAIVADVRVVAATRRDLDAMVQAGSFRDDLFHRLAVARIEIPPLRRRREDVGVLARHFWETLGGADRGLSPALMRRWLNYTWPGNVRELRNAVLRALALGTGPAIDALGAPQGTPSTRDPIDAVLVQDLPLARARQIVVDDFERRYVERLLATHGGNVVRAAEAAGVARRYFQILKTKLQK